MNNSTDFGSPNEPWMADDDRAMQGGTFSVQEGATYSATNWEFLIFMIIWLIGIVILLLMIVTYIYAHMKAQRRHSGGARVKTEQTTREQPQQVVMDEENQEMKQETTVITEDERANHPVRKYSPKGILPIFTTTIALASSIIAQASCKYISTDDVQLSRTESLESFGLWSASIYDGTHGSDDQCHSTFANNFPVDTPMVVARFAAILASVLGCLCFLAVFYFVCTNQLYSKWFSRIIWPLYLAALAQCLVLILLETKLCNVESKCSLDVGGVSSVTATGYWILAALGIGQTAFLASI